MDSVTSGEIRVNGSHIERFDYDKLTKYRTHNVGFVFQSYNLIPNLTARENIELMKEIVDVDVDSLAILDCVDLKNHADHFPTQLSGGEQQRVSIARALAKKPMMLLCDEPTGSLDSKTGFHILELLQEMCKRNNTTVIIVTHNQMLSKAADKTIKIKNGIIESVDVNGMPKKISELNL